jgi:ribonuclease D
VIDRDEKLAELLPALRAANWLALDTEADSLHAYPEKLCLIQISYPGGDVILDPLASMNLTPFFGELSRHELVMHGADYDLRLLRKSYGFVPKAIFDTMLASRLLGCREFGLSNLVSRFLGITLEKGAQKANWGRRPLTMRMEIYARNDTRHLRPLAEILRAQLKETGRLAWHEESCAKLIADCAQFRPLDPDMLWRVKGSHQLDPRGLAVLRELWHWREKEAIKFNRPPHFILPADIMVDLAEACAESGPRPDMLPNHLTSRRQSEIMDAMAAGLAKTDLPARVKNRGYRQSETEKRRMLDLENRRNRLAHDLGLDPTLIASRAMLVMLAKNWQAHAGELMSWQRKLLEQAQV